MHSDGIGRSGIRHNSIFKESNPKNAGIFLEKEG